MMHGGKTGYPAGLLQDDHTKLSKWFASKPDARMIVRQVCKEILEKKHEDHQRRNSHAQAQAQSCP